MIRIALCLLLSGCTVVEHVQVVPVINPKTYAVSCCQAYVEYSKTTQAFIEVQNSDAKGVSVKLGAKFKF
jgi:hypothetical protein